MKIMAVDYGDARTGLAVCDRTEFLASPIGIIEEKSLAKVAEKIVYASREYEVGMIVIGLPKNMDGSEGPRAQKSHKLADTLRAGLRAYERKIAGYTAPEAILTGLETRTSSPVRLKREENFECAQLAGLYPCGEGAGYAGGIMSAAVDGLRVARAIISRYSPAEG